MKSMSERAYYQSKFYKRKTLIHVLRLLFYMISSEGELYVETHNTLSAKTGYMQRDDLGLVVPFGPCK